MKHTNEVHIWKYSLPENLSDNTDCSILSSEEYKRYINFIHAEDAKRYLYNRTFVRNVLSKYTCQHPSQIRFEVTSTGKPYIKNSRLFFNHSYRGQQAILVVSTEEKIGIDIEQIVSIEDIQSFLTSYFTTAEIKGILSSQPADRLQCIFDVWAFKEAFLKANGRGISKGLTESDMSAFFFKETKLMHQKDSPEQWTVKKILVQKGYVAAVAFYGTQKTIVEFNYED
jgi:4'-phosphopantetheinyl transferase